MFELGIFDINELFIVWMVWSVSFQGDTAMLFHVSWQNKDFIHPFQVSADFFLHFFLFLPSLKSKDRSLKVVIGDASSKWSPFLRFLSHHTDHQNTIQCENFKILVLVWNYYSLLIESCFMTDIWNNENEEEMTVRGCSNILVKWDLHWASRVWEQMRGR